MAVCYRPVEKIIVLRAVKYISKKELPISYEQYNVPADFFISIIDTYLTKPKGYAADSIYHIMYLWLGDRFLGKSPRDIER